MTAAAPDGHLDRDWRSSLARRSASFRLAAALFPPDSREEVLALYAFCRRTDDIVDAPDGGSVAERRAALEAWVVASREAYRGRHTADTEPLLARAMTTAAERGVPFRYVEELAEGMRMDLRGTGYGSLAELERYAYRVAAVVGLWMVRLWGFRDPWLLDRAAELGIAMQLTNIARDVAEDWEQGRVYLPDALLDRHGLDRSRVGEMVAGRRPVDDRFRGAHDELLRAAERRYESCRPGLLALPGPVRRPVAAAARVYRGTHGALRSDPERGLRARHRPGSARAAVLAARGVVSAETGSALRRHRRDWQQLYGWAARCLGQVSA